MDGSVFSSTTEEGQRKDTRKNNAFLTRQGGDDTGGKPYINPEKIYFDTNHASSKTFCCEMTAAESQSPRATRDVFKYQRTIIAFNCKINCVKWPDFSLVLRFIFTIYGWSPE